MQPGTSFPNLLFQSITAYYLAATAAAAATAEAAATAAAASHQSAKFKSSPGAISARVAPRLAGRYMRPG